MSQKKIYVLYHANCMDGLGARYAANKRFGDKAEYIPVKYDKPIPEIPDGCEVYIVDFSYPRDVLEALNKRSAKLIVLDHHKTAQEELKGLPYAYFDMGRSGAVLAWQYFFPDIDPPKILCRVQDRDLWRWQYRDTKETFNVLDIAENDFSRWDAIEENFQESIQAGKVITEYQELKIKRISSPENLRFINFRGVKVILLNNDSYTSEVGSTLVNRYPEFDCFIGYIIRADGSLYLSFRSTDKYDCTPLARALGAEGQGRGGGHPKAAGATMQNLSILSEFYNPDNLISQGDVK